MSPDLVARARRERWAREAASWLARRPAVVWFYLRHPHCALIYHGVLRWDGVYRIRV